MNHGKEAVTMGKLIKNMLKGAASAFSISPPPKRRTLGKKRYHPHKSTFAAMKSDWSRVGADFNAAIEWAAHGEK
jgi:hypothetical protein